jgi:predicted transcriptional regulator
MPPTQNPLTRREREIMDVVHRRGRVSVNDVIADLSGEPAYSTVRAQLRVLEEKGHLRHDEEGLRYVYFAATSRQKVRRSAVRHLIDTFFDGSPEQVVEALVGRDGPGLTDESLERIAQLIEQAKRDGRRK